MLKFLTHKLRTHSINEEPYPDQVDEDHDSGTESDDEIDPQELVAPVVMMDSMERMCSVSPADTGCSMESPIPSLILSTPATDAHDPHSSEEELEVINSTSYSPIQSPGLVSGNGAGNNGGGPLLPLIHHHHHHLRISSPAAVVPTSSAAEKRKWSEVGDLSSSGSYGGLIRYSSPENEENMSHYGNLSPAESPPCCVVGRYYGEELGVVIGSSGGSVLEHSGSSDDEVHNLLSTPPLQFRTSPPLEALKPHHPPPCHSTSPSISTTTPCNSGRRTPHTSKVILRSSCSGGDAGSPPPAKVPAQQQQQQLDDGASRYYYCGGYSNEVAAATVAASPRKRSRYGRDGREKLQGNNRPYLDFEKMQQLKTHSVTWRSGEQKRGGELSLCVW